MLQALTEFENEYPSLTLRDFKVFLSLCAELSAKKEMAEGLILTNLAELADGQIQLTQDEPFIKGKMKLQPKSFNRIKITGDEGAHLIDEMLLKLN